jgi:hypothetical protein
MCALQMSASAIPVGADSAAAANKKDGSQVDVHGIIGGRAEARPCEIEKDGKVGHEDRCRKEPPGCAAPAESHDRGKGDGEPLRP